VQTIHLVVQDLRRPRPVPIPVQQGTANLLGELTTDLSRPGEPGSQLDRHHCPRVAPG
jgi:hypothetical protein